MGNKFKYLPYTLVLLGIFLIIGLFSSNPDKVLPKHNFEGNTKNIDFGNVEFSPDGLKAELKRLNIKHQHIVYAQAKLESGNFKSKYFLEKNNLFGFRTKNGYLSFEDWKDCCAYYKKWQDKKYKGGNYYQFLVNIGYAEDSIYIQKLKSCLK